MAALCCSFRRMATILFVADLLVRPSARGAGAVRHQPLRRTAIAAAEAFDDAGIALDLESSGCATTPMCGGAREAASSPRPSDPNVRLHGWSFPRVRSAAAARRGTVVPGCRCRIDAGLLCGVTALEAIAHGLRLARVGYDAQDLVRVEIWWIESRSRARARPRGVGTSPRRLLAPAGLVSDTPGTVPRLEVGGGGFVRKAMWPFSPMPTKATVDGMGADQPPPTRGASACGSARRLR